MKRILLFLVATGGCVFGYVFLLSLMRGSRHDSGSVLAALILAVALFMLNRRFFRSEGETLAEIGFDAPRRRILEMCAAFLAGCGLVALWALVLYGALSAQWRPYDGFDAPSALSRIAFCVFNNAAEELAYRAYLLRKIMQRFGAPAAVLSTSALFAVLHVQGGVPWLSAITIVFTSGVVFAVLFLRWRSLPLVVGFHVATNVAQELAGLRTSGLTVVRPVFEAAASRPAVFALTAAALINLVLALSLARQRASILR